MAAQSAEAAFIAGNEALARGDAAAAAQHYRAALVTAPEVAAVHCNLGAALLATGDAAAAEAALRQAVLIEPTLAAGWNMLGNALLAQRRLPEAAAALERALPLAAAAINLGHVRAELGDAAAAEAAYRTAMGEAPAAAWSGIGLLRRAAHDLAGALAAFDAALAAERGHVEARHNRAVTLQALGRHHEALAALRRLAQEHPANATVQASLGHALQGLGRHGEAAEAFERAIRLGGERNPKSRTLLAFMLHARRQECLWEGLAELEASALDFAEHELAAIGEVAAPPFALAGMGASPALIAAASRRIASAMSGRAAERDWRRHDGETLRVGYLSPDFRDHSAGFSIAALLEAHGRSGFVWHGYAIDGADAGFAERFDRFLDLTAFSDAAAADAIAADGIDVLIDLAGHTRNSRLEILAQRPAPVQAHYLGWGLGLGARFVPYLITDARQTPPDMLVDEMPVYLSDSFMATGRPTVAEPTTRAAAGLPGQGVMIAAFNAAYKLDPAAFGFWCDVLRTTQDSVLWLRAGGAVDGRLRAAARSHGIDPARLIFAPRLPRPEHLARHALADFALDTLGHAGGVTTVDALWAGVPVATLAGPSPAGRTGVSLLTAAGLPELVAEDIEAYRALAMRLATDAVWRGAIRDRLMANRQQAPLFDTPRLAMHLEQAYRLMWQRWRDGLPPARIDVR
jgi:predicted O-linked N-acetylglucosamine transferase (SPINDLY family)